MRPLSVRPVLMARRVIRLSVMVSTVAIAIRTYSGSGHGKRVRAAVHCQRDLRIHPRIKPFLGVEQVGLGTHVARLRIETEGEAGHLADERLTVKARRLDD